MLCYVVLLYFISHYFILCLVILIYFSSYYFILLYFLLCYFIMLLYVMLYYFIMLCYITLCYFILLCCFMLCYLILLCCVVLYYVMLYYFNMLLYVLYLSGPSCPVWVQHGGVYLPNAKLAASLAGQSVDVLSSRNTGSVSRGRRCNVASGWCTTLRQGGYTNHPPFSLLCCATCYCKSPVQQ